MDKQTPLPSENAQRALISAILKGEHAAIQAYLDADSSLATNQDAQGNTPLHYAVAMVDFSTIALLMRIGGDSIAIKNNHGQYAADWLKDLIMSTHHLRDANELNLVSDTIVEHDIESVNALFLKLNASPKIWCIADDIIQQPLHLAIRHHRWDVVDSLLALPLTTKTLDSKDSTGQTPKSLIAKCLVDPRASNAKGRIQELSAAATQRSPVGQPGSPIQSLRPRDYEQHISELNAAFRAGIKKGDDCQQLHHTLPTLLYLVYSAYQQALQQPASPARCNLKRQLLHQLFGGSNAEVYLQRKIKASVVHLEYILKHDLADQLFELSSEYPPPTQTPIPTPNMAATKNDRNKVTGGTICFNLAQMTDTQMVVAIGIHEVAHLTGWGKDSAYYSLGSQDTGWREFNLSACVKLPRDPEQSRLSSNEKVVFDLWYQLEDQEDKINKVDKELLLSRGQHRALLNPDSIAAYVLAAAAFMDKKSHCWINFENNCLYLRAGFLPGVSDSASTYASDPQELRHPPSNMSGLLQEMAAMRPLLEGNGGRSICKQEYGHDITQNLLIRQSSSTPSLNE